MSESTLSNTLPPPPPWFQTYLGSADYFNACSDSLWLSVPNNLEGFQNASTGNAYCGFINTLSPISFFRGYLCSPLLQPLIVGQKYFASFKISFSGRNCPSNKMGIHFSTTTFDSASVPQINNSAQVYTDSVISDTINWFQIKGNFVSDSNYAYITIGNFFDDFQTTLIQCVPFDEISYYYVDDVCVSTDSSICFAPIGIQEIKNENGINVYPNPCPGKFVINLKNDLLGSDLSLYDILGHPILKKTIISESLISVDISDQRKGVYIIKIIKDDSIITNKLVYM